MNVFIEILLFFLFVISGALWLLGMASPRIVAPLFKGMVLSRKKIAFILGLLTFGILILFISVIATEKSPQSDVGESSLQASITPTASSAIANSEEWTTEEKAYLESFAQINGSTSEALNGIGQFTSKSPVSWTKQDLTLFALFTVFVEKGYTDAKLLKAPSKLESLHKAWLNVLRVNSEAMPLFRLGVDTRDARKVNEANALFDEGQRLLKIVAEEKKKVGL